MRTVIEELARAAIGDDRDTLSQCRKLTAWMCGEFEWSVTDYQRRTVDEVLERRSGNCAEQARLLESLLTAVGVETRTVAEINIQAPWIERGQFAEKMVAEGGPSCSVFGYMHNDHRWLEVKDAASGSWFPADATLGICGVHEWLMARMGFESRPEAGKGMIVPIMAFVVDGSDQVLEDRTDYYVIDLFKGYVEETVKTDALIDEWSRLVRVLAQGGKRAFEGDESFFRYQHQLQQAADVYRAIELQYRQAQ